MAILDRTGGHDLAIGEVILIEPPGIFHRALGHDVLAALDIAGGKVEQIIFFQRCLFRRRQIGHGDACAFLLHPVENAADKVRVHIRTERPAGIEIAEHNREVRDVPEHAALVIVMIGKAYRRAVQTDIDLASNRKAKAGCCDNDIRLDQLARCQPHAASLKSFDMAGLDAGLARFHRFEQIIIGHKAKPLLPRIVGRGKILEIIVSAHRLADAFV